MFSSRSAPVIVAAVGALAEQVRRVNFKVDQPAPYMGMTAAAQAEAELQQHLAH
jgi:hypothetical protein